MIKYFLSLLLCVAVLKSMDGKWLEAKEDLNLMNGQKENFELSLNQDKYEGDIRSTGYIKPIKNKDQEIKIWMLHEKNTISTGYTTFKSQKFLWNKRSYAQLCDMGIFFVKKAFEEQKTTAKYREYELVINFDFLFMPNQKECRREIRQNPKNGIITDNTLNTEQMIHIFLGFKHLSKEKNISIDKRLLQERVLNPFFAFKPTKTVLKIYL